MWKSKKSSLHLLVLALILTFFGLTYATSGAKAMMITNEKDLLQQVHSANAGWDWTPHCEGGASWSVGSSKCVGGNGSDHQSTRHHQGSYGLTNQKQLIDKINEKNVGWNWEPRCAGGAHWSWGSNKCVGGNG